MHVCQASHKIQAYCGHSRSGGSPEERDVKPYAMPIQCLAYKSLKDSEDNVVEKLLARKIKVAGIQCHKVCISMH